MTIFDKLIKRILKFIRRRKTHNGKDLCYPISIEGEQLNDYIYQRLQDERPFMEGRLGTELLTAIYPYVMQQSRLQRYMAFVNNYIDIYEPNEQYAKNLMSVFCTCCGFFPNDVSLLDKYKSLLLTDFQDVDLLGCFAKENIFMHLFKGEETCRLVDLEPYDYKNPWTKALEGKKVLIIHPFAETITSQYKKRELLWQDNNVLPAFDLKTLKAVQSIAGEPTKYADWFEALEDMEHHMDAIDYEIAIVGCGAYGFHLCAHAKRQGKKAIHLGGATQILFGIKGKRWDELPAVNKFYNEYWVYPSAEETPKNNKKVENGCYW